MSGPIADYRRRRLDDAIESQSGDPKAAETAMDWQRQRDEEEAKRKKKQEQRSFWDRMIQSLMQ